MIPARAGRREWIGLSVLALACVLYAMDLTVLHLAVPKLSADLQPSSAQLLWIVDIYGFLVAGSLITMGTLGDRIGRRRLLFIGAAAFGAVSLLAAFARSAEMLILLRALMGIAGATLAPSTLSLIFNMFADPQQRAAAIGVWISAFSAGSAIGPVAGGLLLEYFWWGSVFLLAIPVMALLLILGPRVLPEFRNPDAGRLDLRSAATSLLAILAIIYGLKEIAQYGLAWLPALAIAAGLAAGALFLRRQASLADPLIDLALFRIPSFNVALATNVIGVFVAVGYFLFIAQYLQLVLGLSPLTFRAVVAALGGRLHRQLQPGAALRAPLPPGHRAGGGAGHRGHRPGRAHPRRRQQRPGPRRRRLGRHLPGDGPGLVADHRADCRQRPAGTGRRRLRYCRDRRRAGRRAGHRHPRLHRRRGVSRAAGGRAAGGDPGRCSPRRRATRSARRWKWPRS
jgi:MFS transporter, DHA2 family, multidrug resistance protein